MQVRKIRLDLLLVERGLAESRSLAQRLVMAGQVRVNGEVVLRVAANVPPDAQLEVEHGPRYVSRGGEKLEAALQAFNVTLLGRYLRRCGRLHRRFHRLPAAARRRQGVCHRRRPRASWIGSCATTSVWW